MCGSNYIFLLFLDRTQLSYLLTHLLSESPESRNRWLANPRAAFGSDVSVDLILHYLHWKYVNLTSSRVWSGGVRLGARCRILNQEIWFIIVQWKAMCEFGSMAKILRGWFWTLWTLGPEVPVCNLQVSLFSF